MAEIFRILVVNPGSTSSKIALFENEKQVAEKKINYSAEEVARFHHINEQVHFRREALVDFIKEQNLNPSSLSAIVGRGGLLKPLAGGTYKVNADIVADLNASKYGEHASNLGALIAYSFTEEYGIPAYIVDPVIVDEMQDVARYSGLKEIPRRSVWHALNVTAVVRQTCKDLGLDVASANFVTAHIGGGITVSAIEKGRCIDVSNGLDEGPFTPERAGDLPTIELVKLCFSGKYTQKEINKMLVGKGGMVSYLGTSSLLEIENKVLAGDKEFTEVFNAMCYQIAKNIGAYVAVLKGKVDRIIMTGGGARCKPLIDKVSEYVQTFAPIHVVPGEDELSALALGGLRVLRGETPAREYKS
ncbi:MAG: butyrate kinase [Candidatus Riflebacteria bacterium]|nr:butyrate kinase [Candidatus Riflebacteria bacterium]